MTVADLMKVFVPRMEVYQGYVVRLGSVLSLVRRMVEPSHGENLLENESAFGEFVRIQQNKRECQGWRLERFLIAAVERLVDYPAIFHVSLHLSFSLHKLPAHELSQKLLALTPKRHPDYISSIALVHSTDVVLRILHEVKSREEDYELVKSVISSVQGLPPQHQLARRERKLLAHGALLQTCGALTNHDKRKRQGMSLALPPSRTPSNAADQSSRRLRRYSATPNLKRNAGSSQSPVRQSRLLSALKGWTPVGSPSLDPSISSGGFSLEPGLVSESEQVPTAKERRKTMQPPRQSHLEELSHSLGLNSAALNGSDNVKLSIHAFVFTDFLLLVKSSGQLCSERKRSWTLLDDIGISRVLAVDEKDEQLSLDCIPLNLDNIDSESFPDPAALYTVVLSVPDPNLRHSPSAPSGTSKLARTREDWLTTFQKSIEHTLRSLSFPTTASSSDLDLDTRQSIMNIISAGLPFPKSPSIQVDEVLMGVVKDDTMMEREERGWWEVRFQQVLRETWRDSSAGNRFASEPPLTLSSFVESSLLSGYLSPQEAPVSEHRQSPPGSVSHTAERPQSWVVSSPKPSQRSRQESRRDTRATVIIPPPPNDPPRPSHEQYRDPNAQRRRSHSTAAVMSTSTRTSNPVTRPPLVERSQTWTSQRHHRSQTVGVSAGDFRRPPRERERSQASQRHRSQSVIAPVVLPQIHPTDSRYRPASFVAPTRSESVTSVLSEHRWSTFNQ